MHISRRRKKEKEKKGETTSWKIKMPYIKRNKLSEKQMNIKESKTNKTRGERRHTDCTGFTRA